jgi:hypothetical protein
MFANLKFRDEFALPAVGLSPQLYATGSHGGAVIPVAAFNTQPASLFGPSGNFAGFKKWVALVQTGSGGATTLWNAWWGGGSTSNGTMSALPATSTSTFSGSGTYSPAASLMAVPGQQSAAFSASLQYGSSAFLVMEIRAEYINNLGSSITWIQPIVSITGASAYASILTFAFDAGSVQASLYDGNFQALVLQETDAF